MKRELFDTTKNVVAIAPEALSAGAKNSIVLDRFGIDSALFTIFTGTVTGTPTTTSIAIKVQHGDAANGSDMADADVEGVLTTSTVTAAIDAANDTYTLPLNLLGFKRYVRLVATVAFTGGTTPTVQTAAVATFGDATEEPLK